MLCCRQMDWDFDWVCCAVDKGIGILIERVCCAVGKGIGISIGHVCSVGKLIGILIQRVVL